MNLMEQIRIEAEKQCYIKFNVNEDGTLDYDKEHWKLIEPKLRAGWSQAHIFDILSTIVFDKNALITKFTLEVDKKKPSRTLPIKIGDVKVEISGDEVVAEFGGVVNKNLKEIISDIRIGYLPRVMEEFEKSDITQLKVDVCYAQLRVTNCKEELETALSDLKEVQKKLEEYRKNGGNYYGKKEKNN